MVFFSGAHLRQKSLDPERRRQSIGPIPNIHRASDAFLDPHHAAILFRDSRGVCKFDVTFHNVVNTCWHEVVENI